MTDENKTPAQEMLAWMGVPNGITPADLARRGFAISEIVPDLPNVQIMTTWENPQFAAVHYDGENGRAIEKYFREHYYPELDPEYHFLNTDNYGRLRINRGRDDMGFGLNELVLAESYVVLSYGGNYEFVQMTNGFFWATFKEAVL